jgi:hypothetical protein
VLLTFSPPLMLGLKLTQPQKAAHKPLPQFLTVNFLPFHTQRYRVSFLTPFQCHSQSSIDARNGEGIPLCWVRWATILEPEETMGDGGSQRPWPNRSVAGQTASREEVLSLWFFWEYQYPDANDIKCSIGVAGLRGIVYKLLWSTRNLRPSLGE